jgi:hypothetical protein
MTNTSYLDLAHRIAYLFAEGPQVAAVALGGSRGSTAGTADPESDIDLYVYTRAAVPIEQRRAIVQAAGGATAIDLDLQYWGPGDEWLHAGTGIEVDLVYFDTHWMEAQIGRVIDQHQPSLGYTTCFWYTIRQSILLLDRHGWLAALQNRCQIAYPEPLRQNIIALNHPPLRKIIPSYANQLAKAVKRRDLVSINHRLAALFASYFDVLFALNRQLHPGEKRLVERTLAACPLLPANMEPDIAAVLHSAAGDVISLSACVERLLDHLDQLLIDAGIETR